MSRLDRCGIRILTSADVMRGWGIFINKDGGIEALPLSRPDAMKDMRAVGLDD